MDTQTTQQPLTQVVHLHDAENNAVLWSIKNYTPDYFQHLMLLPFRINPPIILMGQVRYQQRDICFLSDESVGYKYSGTIEPAISFKDSGCEWLRDLMQAINVSLGTEFNGILVNRYNNGADYVSAHPDSLDGLSNSLVVSLSYGATRKFRIRNKQTNKIVLDVPHESCMLLVMGGEGFQKAYKHEIPRQLKVSEARISLTFRKHSE